MTEAEWLSETGNAQGMVCTLGELKLPRTKAGRRKLRLFACGCCRVAWSRLPDERLGGAVDAAERFADGLATKDEMKAARGEVEWMRDGGALPDATTTEARVAVDMAVETTAAQAFWAAFYMTATVSPLAGEGGRPTLCDLVRCVFGNPFRPVEPARPWLTPAVVSLARAAYEERVLPSGQLDLARLSVLADAVEDTGCADEAILAHLRSPGPHVRGCWAIDLLLGKQ